jgi:hypothetical protein
VGTLVAAGLVWWLPRRFGSRLAPAGWTGVVAGILAAQILWVPIAGAFDPTEATWRAALAEGTALARWYNQAPGVGHALALPPDWPDITYVLARFGGVEGKHMVSEMYDPLAYLPAGYRIEDHLPAVTAQVQCWLSKTDTRMIAVADSDPGLQMIVQSQPEQFAYVGTLGSARWTVFTVEAQACPASP